MLRTIPLSLVVFLSCTSMPPGELKISKSTPLEFEATYMTGSEWAHVSTAMGLQATSFLLDTSSGKAYVNDGLGLADRSRPIGYGEVEEGSVDQDLVRGLLEALLEAGVSPRPSEEELGTPRYQAAYLAAEALGLQRVRIAFGDTRVADTHEEPTIFPYPGWRSADRIPQEALAQTAGEQGTGVCLWAWWVSDCCGSKDCYWCDPDAPANHGNCAPSCAAGDHCNHFHNRGHCGFIACPACGEPGDTLCPHTCGDNADLTRYGTGWPCNTGWTMAAFTNYCWWHTPEYPAVPYSYNCGGWHDWWR